MARFCFLSLNLVSHCDLGGGSFARLASAMIGGGHDVEWLFSRDCPDTDEERARERLAKEGIAVSGPSNLLLAGFQQDAGEVLRSVDELALHLHDRRVDVAVFDRMCTHAGLAAARAGLPWANVGTDGLSWGVSRRCGFDWLEHGRHESRTFKALRKAAKGRVGPGQDFSSYWGRSPFLNISFLPRSFYLDRKEEMPAWSHFVGVSGAPTGERRRGEALLVALGNTFAPAVLVPLLQILEEQLARDRSIQVLLLAGRSDLVQGLRSLPHVVDPPWMTYEEAFARSYACVGHGGMNFVWHSLQARVLPLIVPSGVGDQLYNATQMQRHGAEVVFPHMPHFSRLFGRGSSGQRLASGDTKTALRRLLEQRGTEPFPLEALAGAMESGGGVPAAVRLLEQLAFTGEAVTACAAERCCC